MQHSNPEPAERTARGDSRPPSERPPPSMESFVRKRLAFLSFFWDKIWPAGVRSPDFHPDPNLNPDPDSNPDPDPDPEPDPAAELVHPVARTQLFRVLQDFTARCTDELSVRRGDRLVALREDGDCILARKLSGVPGSGLIPITHVAKATHEAIPDQP